jgi:ATP-dependent helicase HrpB
VELPVEAVVPDVRAALLDPGAGVLVAPPGSGKSTIVPLRLLDEPWTAPGTKLVVLQPRRVATRAVAARLATLLGEDVGTTVGYRTRDDVRVSGATRIEVVTEGILTRWLQSDPSLPGIAAVLFDEVHERNLQTDLGLALAVEVRRTIRPDLRLLAMSATLAAEKVAALVGGPVITADGSPHPVDVWWTPPPRGGRGGRGGGRGGSDMARVVDHVAPAVRRALADPTIEGDVLVFLPGVGEINRVAGELADTTPDVDVLPLHGSLAAADQDRALQPSRRRRVVLATDIAETSLTVEGVHVVVDAGLAREPAQDPRTGMTRLRTVSVSRASADQRAGRAGRLGPGVAWRLWSQVEHASRRAFTEPEIARVDLAGLALELDVWGGDADELPWLDPPPKRSLDDARAVLAMLGLLGTPLGRRAARLPLHPRLARMVLDAPPADQWSACVLATVLDGRPPPGDAADIALRLDRYDERRARDLARRADVVPGAVDRDRFGPLLALAYPDRIAQLRGSAGRFRLRGGTAAWVPPEDPLAKAPFVVAADLDGRRDGARIRLGAAMELDDVLAVAGDQVREHRRLRWDKGRDDLVEEVARTLDRVDLGTVVRRPPPDEATTDALLDHVRRSRLAALPMGAAESLRARVAFLRRLDGDDRWPDLSDKALLARLDQWLAPFLPGATGRADVETVDVVAALSALLPPGAAAELARSAPESWRLPGGRSVPIDYSAEAGPTIEARVQDLFGVTEHPTVGDGRVAVVVHLLSPARRPVQVTSDLPGFWSGSWREVRKEMAGRYPKHAWPEDPTA